MTHILIVDDSPIEQKLAGRLVEAEPEWNAVYANNGQIALEKMEHESIDLIVSDLRMPNMSGLELLQEVRDRYPSVPVIVMTSRGSEESAARALNEGAAGYIPKRQLSAELVSAINHVLLASQKQASYDALLGSMTRHEVKFELKNDRALVPPAVSYLQQCALEMGICDDRDRTRLGVALEEALLNAVIHGNLEVGSELRGHDDEAYERLIALRQQTPKFKQRRVTVHAIFENDIGKFIIRDQGPGFNPELLPDPTDPENLLKASGRGVMLMRAFMGSIEYNDRGNEVTLTKAKPQVEAASVAVNSAAESSVI